MKLFYVLYFNLQKKGKISLFSRYERVVDRRTFKDRRDLWAIEKEKQKLELLKPKAKIRNIELGVNDDKKRKPRKNAEEKGHVEAASEEAPPADEAQEE